MKNCEEGMSGRWVLGILVLGIPNIFLRSDMANYLEVISAQGSVLLAELNLASIQRQQLSAKVELYRSLGGGWK
jgi:hypothetical protein